MQRSRLARTLNSLTFGAPALGDHGGGVTAGARPRPEPADRNDDNYNETEPRWTLRLPPNVGTEPSRRDGFEGSDPPRQV